MRWKEKKRKFKMSKYYDHGYPKNFLLLFTSVLTAIIAKSSHILAGNFIIFLKKLPRRNLKDFQYQIWASMQRLEQ